MKLLSIETSCDETAVAVLEASGDMHKLAFTVLGNALYSQAQKHAVYGGVFPSLAKREHAVNLVPLLDMALKGAHLDLRAKTMRSLRDSWYGSRNFYKRLCAMRKHTGNLRWMQ
jgi:N6-L-threonylcarbamoyladenine synthase